MEEYNSYVVASKLMQTQQAASTQPGGRRPQSPENPVWHCE